MHEKHRSPEVDLGSASEKRLHRLAATRNQVQRSTENYTIRVNGLLDSMGDLAVYIHCPVCDRIAALDPLSQESRNCVDCGSKIYPVPPEEDELQFMCGG